MVSVPSSAEKVVVLHVGFDVYAAIVAQGGDRPGPRLAYDGEDLELLSPSKDHEHYRFLLDLLVNLLGIEWQIDIEGTGSVTLTVEPRGAEPDSSFYVDNERFRRDAGVLDPPPDIVVEIDLSRERIDKQAIYRAIGVPEFWRYDGHALRAFALVDGGYVEIANSTKLKGLPIATLAAYLDQRSTTRRPRLIAAWQSWLRANRPG